MSLNEKFAYTFVERNKFFASSDGRPAALRAKRLFSSPFIYLFSARNTEQTLIMTTRPIVTPVAHQ